MENETSRIYLGSDSKLPLRKPRIYWGEPGNPQSAPVIHLRKKPRNLLEEPEHRLLIRNVRRKPRIYWGEPGNPSAAPVIYVRKKSYISSETSKKAA